MVKRVKDTATRFRMCKTPVQGLRKVVEFSSKLGAICGKVLVALMLMIAENESEKIEVRS